MSNVDFSDKEIEQALKQQLTGPNRDLLSEAILTMLGDDWKKGLLLKATMGIKSECELILNEEYYISTDNISSYDFNRPAMKEAGIINTDDKIKCRLIQFNPWDFSKYLVEHKWMGSDCKEKVRQTSVHAHYLSIVEEFPEDFT